jgi:hypothetical protein
MMATFTFQDNQIQGIVLYRGGACSPSPLPAVSRCLCLLSLPRPSPELTEPLAVGVYMVIVRYVTELMAATFYVQYVCWIIYIRADYRKYLNKFSHIIFLKWHLSMQRSGLMFNTF